MKIDRVIISWDTNTRYLGFANLVADAWAANGVKTSLVVSSTDINQLPLRGDVRVDELLYYTPAPPEYAVFAIIHAMRHYPGEVCMSSGIDQVPGREGARVLRNEISTIPDDRVVLAFGQAYLGRTHLFPEREGEAGITWPYYPSSHVIARGDVAVDAFGLDRWELVLQRMRDCGLPVFWPGHDKGHRWGIDEAYLSYMLHRWRDKQRLSILPATFWEWWQLHRINRPFKGVAPPTREQMERASEFHLCYPLSDNHPDVMAFLHEPAR